MEIKNLKFFKSDDYKKQLNKAMLNEAIAIILLNTDYSSETSIRQTLRKRAIKSLNK